MPLSVALVVGTAVFVVVVIAIVAGRWQRRQEQADDCDADSRGFIGAILSGLFIVALAFYVVIVWEGASTAEDNAFTEAGALTDLYWQTDVAPEPQRERIRTLVRDYTASVAGEEWPALARGEGDERTAGLLAALRVEINRLPATPDVVRGARDRSLERVREVTDKRRARLDQAGGLSPTGHLMLVATVAGSAGMVAFPLLIGFTARARHVTLLALMAGVLGLTCYLLIDATQPFDGWIMVGPEAFQSASEELLVIP